MYQPIGHRYGLIHSQRTMNPRVFSLGLDLFLITDQLILWKTKFVLNWNFTRANAWFSNAWSFFFEERSSKRLARFIRFWMYDFAWWSNFGRANFFRGNLKILLFRKLWFSRFHRDRLAKFFSKFFNLFGSWLWWSTWFQISLQQKNSTGATYDRGV